MPSLVQTRFPYYSPQDLIDAQAELAKAESAYNNIKTRLADLLAELNTLNTKVSDAQKAYDAATSNLETASANLEAAKSQKEAATQEALRINGIYENALADKNAANNELLLQTQIRDAAQQTFDEAIAAKDLALGMLNSSEASLAASLLTKNQKYAALQQAQYNYDTNLIPDPNWIAPTRQVEHIRTVTNTRQVEVKTFVPRTETVLQEQVIPNLLPNPTLTSTEGWSGVYPGWQGSQPGMYDGEITFSYMDQTVSQGLYSGPFENATLTLSADWFSDWTADSYSMTITAEDINRNPVGTATYTNTRTGHDWTNRSVTLEATGPVSYITVSFSGIDHGFWYGMYGPRMKNPALEVSYGQYVTQTVYDEVITYEEETYYTYETYYTTEVIQPQQGLTVRVYNNLPIANPLRSDTAYNLCKTTTLTSINHNWSGGDILGCGSDKVMLHYTGYITPTENITSLRGLADDGFYLDINGVNAINNWTLKGCGGNWNPVTLQAGQSYAIDAWFYEWGGGACSILNYQSASGEGVVPEAWYSNGASAPLINDASLLPAIASAQEEYDAALDEYNNASAAQTAAQTSYESASTNFQVAEADLLSARSSVTSAESQLLTKTTSYEEVAAIKTTTEQELTTATELVATSEEFASTTQADKAAKAAALETTNNELTSVESTVVETKKEIVVQETKVKTLKEKVAVIEATPEPEPEGAKEIPKDLSADNLMEVNLDSVDPTELTPEQADQLKEAALETFETAEEGSPEYEQALDALYLAAEQDDIVLDSALAAIPGLAAATELVNFLGNAGADMSPKTREESKKVVVTAVVAAGAAIQSAASAAAGSSGSTTTRRK